MQILIDSALFQLSHWAHHGVPVDWFARMDDLSVQSPNHRIILLNRQGTQLPEHRAGVHIVSGPSLDPSDLDSDDEMLRCLCRELGTDLFIGTCLTRAPGVDNVVMLPAEHPHRCLPEIPFVDPCERFRAVDTAHGLIGCADGWQKAWSHYFPHIVHLPAWTISPEKPTQDRSSDLRSMDTFLWEVKAKTSILLTAIVSTYNSARFIRGCIESLGNQTMADQMEIVVVDSASEQGEAAIVREFQKQRPGIRYIRTPKRESVYQAWNRGIKFAAGKYITNANTDDRHRRDALEKMVAVLEDREEIALVYADVIKTRTANETFNRCTPVGTLRWFDWDRPTLLEKGCFIGPQPVWRKKVHETYGYFDESFEVSSDFEFWLRISQTNEFYHIPMPLGLYLERPDSIEHANNTNKIREDRMILNTYRKAAHRHEIIRFDNPGQHVASELQVSRFRGGHPPQQNRNYADTDTGAEKKQGGKIMNSPETILNAIQYLIEGGHEKAALWALQKLVTDFPDHAKVHEQTAALAYEAGDMNTAGRHLQETVRLQPDNWVYRKSFGDFCYVVEKDELQALRQYRRVLEAAPRNLETLTLAGHIALSQHRYDEAREYYHRILEMNPDNQEIMEIAQKIDAKMSVQESVSMNVEEIQSEAEDRIQAGDKAAAIELLNRLLQCDCDQAKVHNDLGVLHYECGDMATAREHYEQATAMLPENEIYQINLADFYWFELGDSQLAMQRYLQVLKLNPRDVEALLGCAQICMAVDRMADAGDFLNTALEIEPDNENARRLQMRLREPFPQTTPTGDKSQVSARRAEKTVGDAAGSSLEEMKQRLAENPEDAALHNCLGVMQYEAGNKEQARSSYEKAVRLAPGESTYQKNLADYYMFESGRTEDAMKLYLEVLTRDPEDVEALNATAAICTTLGNLDDARYFYRRVLEIEPWNENASAAMSGFSEDGGVPSQCERAAG